VLRSFGDSNIFGESYGEGPLRVVWLHGWARSASDFAVAASTLAQRGVGSVALDLPGFGASPPPEVAGGARHYAALLEPALSAVSDEPVLLVGHSFGGTVATVVASTHPERVNALVLTGAPVIRRPSTRKAPLAYRSQRWLHAKGLISDARIESARQKFGSVDYRRARGLMRDVLVASVNESYESELAALTIPVEFLWGDADRDVPLLVAEQAGELVRGNHSLRVVSGTGHLVPLDAPDELVDAVLRVLAR
jgi:pimeloyl-ACP methyl ester carboxylesterase